MTKQIETNVALGGDTFTLEGNTLGWGDVFAELTDDQADRAAMLVEEDSLFALRDLFNEAFRPAPAINDE